MALSQQRKTVMRRLGYRLPETDKKKKNPDFMQYLYRSYLYCYAVLHGALPLEQVHDLIQLFWSMKISGNCHSFLRAFQNYHNASLLNEADFMNHHNIKHSQQIFFKKTY